MKTIVKIFIVVFFVFYILPLYAWNAKGHRIIARIAYKQLKPSVKQKVNYLIKLFQVVDYRDNTFVKAAGWADLLRYDEVTAFNHWHYINLPFSMNAETPLPSVESKNIVWAIDCAMQAGFIKRSIR